MENYKQIKSDLDQLRSIVEKSELWVYKRQGPDEAMDAGEVPEHKKVPHIYRNYKLIFYSKVVFAYIFIMLCSAAGLRSHRQAKESREHEQLQLQSCKGGNNVVTNNAVLCCCTAIKDFLQKMFLFRFSFVFLYVFPTDPAASQQVVCPRRPVGSEEQEAAAEAAQEHGGSHCGS